MTAPDFTAPKAAYERYDGILLGANVSVAKTGLLAAVEETIRYDANTFMIYTRSNRGGKARPITEFHRDEGWALMRQHAIADPVVHLSYLVNLASPKPDTWAYGVSVLREEIERVAYLGFRYIVMHPGSHVGEGPAYAIERIAEGLNEVLTGEEPLTVCLETMAGDGSKVGNSLEEIAAIIERVHHGDKLGVCIDTCHNHSYGYDIVSDFDGFLELFDRILGLDRLKVVHINDSKTPFGSRKDRHANIGEGSIGLAALKRIVHHEQLRGIPLILETPGGKYRAEMDLLLDRPRGPEELYVPLGGSGEPA
ncbi:MAG: deoxyribonuclease IV [Chloroflexi bacterium]|uniref:Probable endonuclease 4 n=1 Tax=Alicyclobacillus cellulosilyticus TaxID=1003997 RepID=A0A917K4P1_9BACL|nr:deoxyribonuclease IV [Alicyclobacillus cellulosilyticus]MBX6773613.1 deoxyribonuclease IV [Chloroflexota bacterium]GGI98067.1 putative endonuclease 4 [Alicyclobacillus cellulosilyticus]